MNLLRLLTAGRSLIGVKQEMGRYKLSDPRSMPKFGGAGNPFKPKLEGRAVVAPAKAPEKELAPEEPAEEESGCGEPKAVASRLEVPAGVPAAPLTPEIGRPGKVSFLKRIWQRMPSREQGSKAVPVQGELSLDNIQVMRNDLSESDLEVVPLRTRRATGPGPEAMGCAAAEAEATPLEAERA